MCSNNYKSRETKEFFHYKWFGNAQKQDFCELPPYEAFLRKLMSNNHLGKDFVDDQKLMKNSLYEQQALKKPYLKTGPLSSFN